MARRERKIEVKIKVEYVPFPDEHARQEAHRTHVELFLKAMERRLRKGQAGAESCKEVVQDE